MSLAGRWRRGRWRLYAPVYDRLAAPFESGRARAVDLLNPRPDDRIPLVGAGTLKMNPHGHRYRRSRRPDTACRRRDRSGPAVPPRRRPRDGPRRRPRKRPADPRPGGGPRPDGRRRRRRRDRPPVRGRRLRRRLSPPPARGRPRPGGRPRGGRPRPRPRGTSLGLRRVPPRRSVTVPAPAGAQSGRTPAVLGPHPTARAAGGGHGPGGPGAGVAPVGPLQRRAAPSGGVVRSPDAGLLMSVTRPAGQSRRRRRPAAASA